MASESAVEVAMFRLKPGADRATFLASAKALTDALRRMSGYRGSEFSEADDGQWIEILHWDSVDDAVRANAITEEPETEPFLEHVDPDSIRHLLFCQVSVAR